MRYSQLHDAERKQAFGLAPSDKWPDEGLPGRYISTNGGTYFCWVEPKAYGRRQTRRCFVTCHCGQKVEAGHLGQHLQGKRHGEAETSSYRKVRP